MRRSCSAAGRSAPSCGCSGAPRSSGPEDPEGATIARVEQYISEALQPFVDLKIASAFDVEAWRVDTQQIDAYVVIYRGPNAPVELRFQVLWTNTRSRGPDVPWDTPTLKEVRSLVRDNVRASLPGADASVPNSVLRVLSDAQGGLCI